MCKLCNTPRNQLYQIYFLKCCKNVTHIPEGLCNVRDLFISDCKLVDSIPRGLHKLRLLYCIGLPLLKELPSDMKVLDHLEIRECSAIENLPKSMPQLSCLTVCRCPRLRSVPNIFPYEHVFRLRAYNCPMLITYSTSRTYYYLEYAIGCRWLDEKNIALMTRIQKRFRRKRMSKIFEHYIKTEEFNMWVFAPNKRGGACVKRHMMVWINNIKPQLSENVIKPHLPESPRYCTFREDPSEDVTPVYSHLPKDPLESANTCCCVQ